MPTFVYSSLCKGCGKCVDICPADNMQYNPKNRKGYNADPIMCAECMNCVKYCPEHAVDVRPYADFAPLGARIGVVRDTKKNIIYWRIMYRDGTVYEMASPIRTTPWGSAKGALEYPERTDLDSELLAMEDKPEYLGFPELPRPKQTVRIVGSIIKAKQQGGSGR
ncbi:adenylyl-sulfate reductase subunit beta [Pyrobaculum sp.]|uniref:adenylyl-sulfate reductase subunit beta n=1 Tax=Pyrobaculum sp. TaxID=2004705 RepID=UPI003167208A